MFSHACFPRITQNHSESLQNHRRIIPESSAPAPAQIGTVCTLVAHGLTPNHCDPLRKGCSHPDSLQITASHFAKGAHTHDHFFRCAGEVRLFTQCCTAPPQLIRSPSRSNTACTRSLKARHRPSTLKVSLLSWVGGLLSLDEDDGLPI